MLRCDHHEIPRHFFNSGPLCFHLGPGPTSDGAGPPRRAYQKHLPQNFLTQRDWAGPKNLPS